MSQKLIYSAGVNAKELHGPHWGMTPGWHWCYQPQCLSRKHFCSLSRKAAFEIKCLQWLGEEKVKKIILCLHLFSMKHKMLCSSNNPCQVNIHIFNMPGYQSWKLSFLTCLPDAFPISYYDISTSRNPFNQFAKANVGLDSSSKYLSSMPVVLHWSQGCKTGRLQAKIPLGEITFILIFINSLVVKQTKKELWLMGCCFWEPSNLSFNWINLDICQFSECLCDIHLSLVVLVPNSCWLSREPHVCFTQCHKCPSSW